MTSSCRILVLKELVRVDFEAVHAGGYEVLAPPAGKLLAASRNGVAADLPIRTVGLDGIGDLWLERSDSLGGSALRNSAERPAVVRFCVPRNAQIQRDRR